MGWNCEAERVCGVDLGVGLGNDLRCALESGARFERVDRMEIRMGMLHPWVGQNLLKYFNGIKRFLTILRG